MKVTITIEDLPPERVARDPFGHAVGETAIVRPNDTSWDPAAVVREVSREIEGMLFKWGYLGGDGAETSALNEEPA